MCMSMMSLKVHFTPKLAELFILGQVKENNTKLKYLYKNYNVILLMQWNKCINKQKKALEVKSNQDLIYLKET